MADEGDDATRVDARVRAAFRAQLRARQTILDAGATHVGWKVALHVPAVEAVLGDRPAFGHLTSATRLDPGGAFRAGGFGDLRAESEVAVVLGRDVRSTDDPAAVRAAIAGLASALELVDVAPPVEGFEGVVADNVYHRAFVLGPTRPVPPGTPLAATLWVNGERRATGATAEDFVAKLRAIAWLLEAVGEGLRAGDRVITGSLTHVPVRPGDAVEIALDPLARWQSASRRRPATRATPNTEPKPPPASDAAARRAGCHGEVCTGGGNCCCSIGASVGVSVGVAVDVVSPLTRGFPLA